MLPGAGGAGVADAHGPRGREGADAIGHQTVGGPVAAADYVAGAGGGNVLRALLRSNLEQHLHYTAAYHRRYYRIVGRHLKGQIWRISPFRG